MTPSRSASRRDFLKLAATIAAAGSSSWLLGQHEGAGPATNAPRHILPTATADAILVKVSWAEPLSRDPVLLVDNRRFIGAQTDGLGCFWSFHATGLSADTNYELQLTIDGREAFAPWTLRTMPAADSRQTRMRLLIFTCAGGHEELVSLENGRPLFLSASIRRRLLQRALREKPDALMAVGDHVYWDARYGKAAAEKGCSPIGQKLVGDFIRSEPVLGGVNEGKLHRAVWNQIGDLYGTMCRSVPTFFIQDDHDYFENDYATEDYVTFPPDPFMLGLARATQAMYYPEFLPTLSTPRGLPGGGEAAGCVRWGDLLELLVYDCRRFQTLKGAQATLIPFETEDWLKQRMADPAVRHIVNVPAMPLLWSAGKWGEWYPDLLQASGALAPGPKTKFMWQSGWIAQHDRLLAAASAMRGRVPLFLSGDLHALGCGMIHRTGKTSLGANPVASILTGPIGTGQNWPSAFRGVEAKPSATLEAQEILKPIEQNGFTIVDFSPERIICRFFGWDAGTQPVSAIDELQPFYQTTLEPRV